MKQKSIKINFVMNIVLSMSTFVFQLITFPYISRVLLPGGTGKVSFATSLVYYFGIFAQLGIPTYGIRACAKVRDDKEKLTRTTQELLIINLVMSAVTYLVLFIAVMTVPRLQEDRLLIFVVSSNIFLTAIGIEWFYKALEQYAYITMRSIIFKIIALIAMFILVKNESDYVIYGAITVIASSLSYVLNLINVRNYISLKPIGEYHFKEHLKMVAIFFAMSCATTIYVNLNTVVLGFYKTDVDVGYYDASIKIRKILATVVTSLGTVLLPRASFYIEHNLLEEFKRITKKGLDFVFLLAVPVSVYFFIFAREGILFLSGEAYMDAVIPMQIIMPTVLFVGLTNLLGIQILVPTGREKVVLKSEIAGATADLVACFVLIPVLSAKGAAIGALLAELSVLVVQWYALKEELKSTFKSIPYFKIILMVLIASVVSWPAKFISLNCFGILAISSVLFFGTYGVGMLITKEPFVLEMFNSITMIFRKRQGTK